MLLLVQLFVLAPHTSGPPHSRSGREDLSQISAGTSRLPAASLSKLSLVSLQDEATPSSKPLDAGQHMSKQDADDKKSGGTLRRPLIEELTL